MKVPILLAFACLTVITQAATSDILFARGGSTFPGRAGNIVFNGEHFVAPCVQSNGSIQLVFLDAKAITISNVSLTLTGNILVSNLFLSITGSTPRIARNGSAYLLAWIDTNTSASVLKCAAVSNGIVGPESLGETNVSEETLSLSAAAGKFLAVFQSGNAVYARQVDGDGSFSGSAFNVSPSAQAQLNPSVDSDGTNHLICWMEQNVASNDWRVMAQRITAGALDGSPVQVSETNSMRPYQTACSFGTNYLVAWSADEGPWTIPTNTTLWFGQSNLWRPTVRGRMLSEAGVPLRHEFPIQRFFHYNTNVAIAFGGGRYLVASYNWPGFLQRLQPLAADGTRVEYPFSAFAPYDWPLALSPSLAFGGGAFCVIYSDSLGTAHALVCAPAFRPEIWITGLRRTNDSIMASFSSSIQISTNLIDWQYHFLGTLPSGRPQLFVRQYEPQWVCIENLRRIDWAKQNWAFDVTDILQASVMEPTDADLFLPGFPKPACPLTGAYSFQPISSLPTCNLGGHVDWCGGWW